MIATIRGQTSCAPSGSALLYRGRTEEAKLAFEESVKGFLAAGRMGEAAMTMSDLQLTMWELGDQEWSVTLDRAFNLTEADPAGEARAVVLTSMAGAAMGRATTRESESGCAGE